MIKGTLKELWFRNGNSPLVARADWWEEGFWYCIMGIAPGGLEESYGFTNEGVGIGFKTDVPGWTMIKNKQAGENSESKRVDRSAERYGP